MIRASADQKSNSNDAIWRNKMIDNSNKEYSDNEILLAEAVMKLAALERILIKAKVITQKDMEAEMKSVSDEVIKALKNAAATITPTPTTDETKN